MAITLNGTTGVTTTGLTSNGIDDNATSTAMTLDSNGRVAIGGTTVTDVNMLNIQGSGASSNIGIVFNDTNTSKVYGIQNGGSTLKFFDYTASAERMRIDSSGHAIIPAGVTLGTSAGVYNAANTLDDYEEGTFAPTFTPETSGSLPLQNSYDTMQYVKIGNWVTLSGFIRASSPSSAVGSSVNVGNFPFTVANLSDAAGRSSGSVSYFDDSAGNWSVLPCYIVESQTQAYLKIDSSTIGNNDGFYISLNYRTT